MADYYQVKNQNIFTPPANISLGNTSNQYSNVYVQNNLVVGNVTVTSSTIIAPRVTTITYPGNDTAADPAGGQTITLTGSGFVVSASILINSIAVSVVSVVSSTVITFTSPANSSGSYVIYVVNPDGSTAIAVPGIQYSGIPTWTTAAGTLGSLYETASFTQTVTATGDAPITYSVASGTLPPGATFNGNGTITGTSQLTASPTTYTFTVSATDAEQQDTNRSFSLTINTDVVTWTTPAANSTTTLSQNVASTTTLLATSAAGKAITYTANALPTGLSISGATVTGTPTVTGNTTSLFTATAATTGRTTTATINWTISVANDLYFPYTTLLLSGQTSTSTFIADASTNNFALTISGDTKPNNFNPYTPGYYSNYFDGTGDYLSIANNAALNLGNNSWTCELWIYPTGNYTTYNTLFAKRNSASLCAYEGYLTPTNGYLGYYNGTLYTSATAPNTGKWNHIAYVFDGTNIKIYLNGTQVLSSATSNADQAVDLYIGMYNSSGTPYDYYFGYISNFRLVKGVAVYTGTFTPPTAPLTATQGAVSLPPPPTVEYLVVAGGGGGGGAGGGGAGGLLTATGYAVSAGSAITVTVGSGGAANTNGVNSVFGSILTYGGGFGGPMPGSGSVLGGSGGSGGGAGSWDSASGTPSGAGLGTAGQGYNGGIYGYGAYGDRNAAGGGGAGGAGSSAAVNNVGGAGGPGIASSISGTSTYYAGGGGGTALWPNGSYTGVPGSVGAGGIGGGGAGGSYSPSVAAVAGTANTGGGGGGNYGGGAAGGSGIVIIRYADSYAIAACTGSPVITVAGGYRVYKFLNSGTITFNTETIAAVTGTQTSLLTCQSNRFIDNSTNAFTITVYGNTTVNPTNPFVPNTAYAAYGSTYFDGTGDTLTIPSPTTGLSFGTGEFTIEMWVYKTSAENDGLLDARSAPAATPWFLGIDASNFPYFYEGTSYTSSVAVTLNSWSHLSVVRTSGVLKIFVNGVQGYSASYGTNLDRTAGLVIGDTIHAAAPYLGYISNLRIVKGTAVYTAAFTPPTAPLTAIANTSLLTLQTNQPVNNSVFLDNSTNAFVVTRAGNTTQGTFSPYGANWSNYFDGTGDYLSLASNAAFTVSTGDLTIEAWIYCTSLSQPYQGIVSGRVEGGGHPGLGLNIDDSKLFFTVMDIGSGLVDTINVPLNQWLHVVGVRSGTNAALFVNGVRKAFSASNSANGTSSGMVIGRYYTATNNYYFSGYISNTRIVKGTAVYNPTLSTLMVPTTPLTAIANTSLLTCQSNRFIDNSANAFTITKNGDTSVQRFSPFAPSASYSASTTSGSAYFDGTGDYLSVTGTALNLVTGDFTIEVWAYIVAGSTYQFIIGSSDNSAGFMMIGLNVPLSPTSTIAIGRSGINWPVQFGAGTTIVSNTWTHIAITRSGTTNRAFINGTQLGANVTDSTSWSFPSNTMWAGFQTGGTAFNGYMTDLRIVKGTAVYTSAFVPPITPLTALQNTVLLNNMTSAGIYDAAMMNNMETVGDAKLSTTQSKFGGGSMSFDGTGDYLSVPSTVNLNFGTGDFTIECWAYFNSLTNYPQLVNKHNGSSGWFLEAGSNVLYFGYGVAGGQYYQLTGITLTTSTWYHIASTRVGSILSIFLNGVKYSSTISGAGTSYDNTAPVLIGTWSSAGYDLNGYIDDLRITKGYARYTANFAPPTAAFPTY